MFFVIAPLPEKSAQFRGKGLFAVPLLQRVDQVPELPRPLICIYVTEALGHEEHAVQTVEPHELFRAADSCISETEALESRVHGWFHFMITVSSKPRCNFKQLAELRFWIIGGQRRQDAIPVERCVA